jgi:hypothetical protein
MPFIRPSVLKDSFSLKRRKTSVSTPNFPLDWSEDKMAAAALHDSPRGGTGSLCRHVSFKTPLDDPSLVRIFSAEDPDLCPNRWVSRAEAEEDGGLDEEQVRMSWFCLRRH